MTAAVRPARDPDSPIAVATVGTHSSGWWGTVWLCASEAALFACLLASYFYLRASVEAFGAEGGRYVPLARPLLMTAMLLASSGTAVWAERGIRKGDQMRLRIGLALTFVLGVAFLGTQATEYAARETGLTTSAYDSLFVTITGIHGAHVALGLLMNLWVQLRAWLGHFDAERHEAVGNSLLYWHFVDAVWIAILACLYLSPRLW